MKIYFQDFRRTIDLLLPRLLSGQVEAGETAASFKTFTTASS